MRWTLALIALMFAGCGATGTFSCATSEQCRLNGTVGVCEATGYCSVTDSSCTSGRRYDPSAGDRLADTCVADETPCTTYSTQFDTCALPVGSDLVIAGAATYNTDTGVAVGMPDPTSVVIVGPASMIRVLVVNDLTINGGTLRVVGSMPVGIAAYGTITIDNGGIDLTDGGAGARTATACATSAGSKGQDDLDGAAGGGGSGFGFTGGNGGDGDGGQAIGGPLGVMMPRPAGPLGGCRGGAGGNGSAPGGAGAPGGGAIVLASPISITIAANGVINAGGGGGRRGAGGRSGGGGAGSGGMILLEAPSVSIAGVVAANGGGGGSGGPNAHGASGLASGASAQGGQGVNAGNGGDGSNVTICAGEHASNSVDAGGGGGGSCGYIAIASASIMQSGTSSPAYAPWP